MRRLWRFRGGIKLSGHKALSSNSSIQPLPMPERLVLPLQQHIGGVAEALVQVGDKVRKGQCLAQANQYVSAPIHAPTSGTVIDIGPHTLPHPSGLQEYSIVLVPDGLDSWDDSIRPTLKPDKLTAAELLQTIRNAGIVGLGGAVFPSAVKLKPTRVIDTLVVNGVECEPYITCDDALMRARPAAILRGAMLLRRIVDAAEIVIAVEDNKPAAIQSLQQELQRFKEAQVPGAGAIEVVAVPTVFPAGGEKQLIKVLTGKEVPQQGLPYEVGVVCMNVATTAAVYDAVFDGRPLISRIVTLTGEAAVHPGNYEVLLGTPVSHLLNSAGVKAVETLRLIMGGPMMGMRLPQAEVPIVKASNCILVQAAEKLPVPMPCIRCGSCARACPMGLLPQQLYWYARAQELPRLERYHLKDCIECGVCAVVCPSHIPLVQYFRFAKTAIADEARKKEFAAQSRLRNEQRQARLDRQARELEARKAQRKAARQRKPAGDSAVVNPATENASASEAG